MKTAMQELIDDLSNNMVISIFERIERNGIFIKALEKEKEQIIDAYYGKINGVFEYREEGQEYYNQTFNQNK
jgi:hypothetical protein